MKTSLPLKVQSIKSKGQKQRPYVYLSAELVEKTGLKQKDLVEWELIGRRKFRDPNLCDFLMAQFCYFLFGW